MMKEIENTLFIFATKEFDHLNGSVSKKETSFDPYFCYAVKT
jgi:hypothetical protein